MYDFLGSTFEWMDPVQFIIDNAWIVPFPIDITNLPTIELIPLHRSSSMAFRAANAVGALLHKLRYKVLPPNNYDNSDSEWRSPRPIELLVATAREASKLFVRACQSDLIRHVATGNYAPMPPIRKDHLTVVDLSPKTRMLPSLLGPEN